MSSKIWDYLFLTFIVIGGINWGLIGLFNFNLITFLFGSYSWWTRVLYIIVGVCALIGISFYGRIRRVGGD